MSINPFTKELNAIFPRARSIAPEHLHQLLRAMFLVDLD